MCETVDFFKIGKTQISMKNAENQRIIYYISYEIGGGCPLFAGIEFALPFFKKFFIFLFFSPTLAYIFYYNFCLFSPMFHVFLACFSGVFGLILCCWSVGFSVLFRYGCLRINGKFRQKAILLLV